MREEFAALLLAAFRRTPPIATLALCSALDVSTSTGTDQPECEGEHDDAPSARAGRLGFGVQRLARAARAAAHRDEEHAEPRTTQKMTTPRACRRHNIG